MKRLVTSKVPFVRGQQVAVFPKENASGTTLGYFGWIVDAHRCNPIAPCDNPDSYVYSVFVPFFAGAIDVRADALLLVEGGEQPKVQVAEPELRWDIRFFDSDTDEHEIRGEYRLRGRNWSEFTFLKSVQLHPIYELSLPADPSVRRTPTLLYRVPSDQILNREFVLRMLTELLGRQDS